ncbi:MAG: Tyrosine phosphatase [Actinomycetia bacterium]|nr:Tyrosine phosphatase [Actinomycetes bacterium]
MSDERRGDAPAADGRFRVLVVCTGNLCRSPIAERLAQRTLLDRLGADFTAFSVSSAGTFAEDGTPMHPLAATTLAERGVSADGFVTRSLTRDHVAAADLVLTAGREHRAQCVELHPASLSKCFTVRQWTRLLDAVDPAVLPAGDPAARARALWIEVLAGRNTLQPGPPGSDDLPDPMGNPAKAFRACADELSLAMHRTFGLIAGG